MANKILESLTIDGTTFDLHSAQVLFNSKEITLSNRGTWYTGGTLTITEPGVYLFLGAFTFPVTATTGQTYHLLRITSSLGTGRALAEFSPANNVLSLQVCDVIKITSVPATFSVEAMCYSVINTASVASLTGFKLIDLGEGE